jgi:hypothetical protein
MTQTISHGHSRRICAEINNAPASVNKFFHFALKFTAIRKPSGVFDAPCISDYDIHFLVHSGPHFKLNGKAVISFARTKYVAVSRFCVAQCLVWQRFGHNARYANEKQSVLRHHTCRQHCAPALHAFCHGEVGDLKTARDNKKSSELHGLCPFLDRYEMLRVSGSLKNYSLPYVNQHPTILP